MKKKITTSLMLITFAFCSFAQVHSDKLLKSSTKSIENLKTITFVQSSENQEILFDINGSNKSMDIVIHYLLNSGEFKLEIYDPQGAIYEQAVTIDSKYEFAGFPLSTNKVRLDEDTMSEIEKVQSVKKRYKYTGPLSTNKVRLDEDTMSEIEKGQNVVKRYKYTGSLPTNKVRLDEDALSEIEKGQNVEGRLAWFVDKPEEGKWKVLLIPNEADGKVTITFNE